MPARVFLGVGVFIGGLAILYWFTSYEHAGTAMLVLAAALSLWCGAYLWLWQRSPADTPHEIAEPYLPHSSPWPFLIGLGAFFVAQGVIVGLWFALPGAAVLAAGIGGFVRQTRLRR